MKNKIIKPIKHKKSSTKISLFQRPFPLVLNRIPFLDGSSNSIFLELKDNYLLFQATLPVP